MGDVGEIRFDDTLGWSVVFESARLSPGFTLHLGTKPKRELCFAEVLMEALNKQGLSPAEIWLDSELEFTEYPYEFVRVLIIQFQTH